MSYVDLHFRQVLGAIFGEGFVLSQIRGHQVKFVYRDLCILIRLPMYRCRISKAKLISHCVEKIDLFLRPAFRGLCLSFFFSVYRQQMKGGTIAVYCVLPFFYL